MRAFNAPARRTAATVTRKTWQWNADAVQADEARAKELQNAQRRFRKGL